ncbi:Utp11 protein [Acanthamoeba castellanii str. Neff]|uniref:U3 small nucleolar RNA-associated protein 11 n=1 Tax=Acanthamoeba castellanii (strain ATCC 30010 / Neff) TaxID=1257118 RepID=L8H7S0_ACACF|nr:Utp11 protein [Acanthamoeba castellanii str. Neff]ELR21554.1 Utp11 protein [Acanthamoeba castellanii str. Neff]
MSFVKDLQRAHKERAQPRARQRYGLLEKKKDYKLRARDYKKKQAVLKNLRVKAANRNPDEFYFKMIKSKTVGGVHTRTRRGKRRTQTQMVNMKTQDMMYYVAARQTEKKALTFRPENYFNTLPELVDRRFNRPTLEQLQSEELFTTPVVAGQTAAIASSRKRQYSELKQRMQREKSLAQVVEKVSSKRQVMMSKGAGVKKMKVEDSKGNVKTLFKWKKVRSK